jgi:phosphate transport system substrate-binding protein
VGHGVYKDSIPTLDDRDALLYQYEPFRSGSKAVVLDEAPSLQFDRKTANNIRLDGATALYPVYASFVQNVWPAGTDASRYTAEGYGALACSGTIHAYTRLLKGEADMIFAAAPSETQIEAARNAGVEFHLTPIGREAFVFFVNSKNPVEDLTVEQIRGIYTGEITNWKEVGGKNQSIRPFQRAENSGSQSALLRLMEGLPLMEPETEDRIAGMGGIINEVASYRNYKNAIGFSFRYYSTEMVQNGDIKLLALNGVEPTRETIRDGSYPISSYFYAVTASPIGEPAAEETEMEAFLEWILSPQGQAIIEKVGYVSLFS